MPVTLVTDRVFSLEFTDRMLLCLVWTLGMMKPRGLILRYATTGDALDHVQGMAGITGVCVHPSTFAALRGMA